MDNLAKDAFLARQNKMSYGQYMAKFNPPKEPVKKKPIDHMYRRICAYCGKEFVLSEKRNKKYCSLYCGRNASYEREMERLKQDGES